MSDSTRQPPTLRSIACSSAPVATRKGRERQRRGGGLKTVMSRKKEGRRKPHVSPSITTEKIEEKNKNERKQAGRQAMSAASNRAFLVLLGNEQASVASQLAYRQTERRTLNPKCFVHRQSPPSALR